MKSFVDYIIVGQGIAGSVLAHTFLEKGKTIVIVDDPTISKSSRVAAGLYNPIVFKRLIKSWRASDLIPYMDEFYKQLEHLLNYNFYYKKEIVKLFVDENEKLFWLKKSLLDTDNYLDKQTYSNFSERTVNNSFGLSKVLNAGNIDTTAFLNSSGDYFRKLTCLIKEVFDFGDLTLHDDFVEYKNHTASKIIFCEGYKAIENPYFDWLPFKLTKGEVLTIKTDEAIIDEFYVLNKGVFVLPLGNCTYKIGATYEWEDLTENITEKGKGDLVDKLSRIIKIPFSIIEHSAGIRPTVIDRRPLIGIHPKHKSIAIFNGMGTKGVMIAPYFANHFHLFLENKSVLEKEVDINRFKII